MDVRFNEDLKAYQEKKPALKKLQYMPTVNSSLKNVLKERNRFTFAKNFYKRTDWKFLKNG